MSLTKGVLVIEVNLYTFICTVEPPLTEYCIVGNIGEKKILQFAS